MQAETDSHPTCLLTPDDAPDHHFPWLSPDEAEELDRAAGRDAGDAFDMFAVLEAATEEEDRLCRRWMAERIEAAGLNADAAAVHWDTLAACRRGYFEVDPFSNLDAFAARQDAVHACMEISRAITARRASLN